jgi:hypothetical protein
VGSKEIESAPDAAFPYFYARLMFGIRGNWRRTVPAGLALASVVACSLALPLPGPPVKSKATVGAPFPCQQHACGCPDAEACWRDCCCFTPQEKLAWAVRQGVVPPELLTVAAQRSVEGGPPCCQRSCCDKSEAGPPRRGGQSVILIMALKCRGVQVSVTLMPPSLPVECGGFSQEWVEFYPTPVSPPVLYDPPLLAVATPPPDAAAA